MVYAYLLEFSHLRCSFLLKFKTSAGNEFLEAIDAPISLVFAVDEIDYKVIECCKEH